MKNYNQKNSVLLETPTAHITKNKLRIKQFQNTVYLQNGDEFEIELFNPTIKKILCEIEINGISLSSGIILRPGERVFLERFLNEPKKFIFETYTVSGKDDVVKNAIKNNGNVTVKFYKEKEFNIIKNNEITSVYNIGTTTTIGTGASYGYVKPTVTNENPMVFYQSSLSIDEIFNLDDKIETGRIEKGSVSNQSFEYYYTSFENFYFFKSEWKILPYSQKQVFKESLVVYCTQCGTKRKKESHKFCPNCGTKY